MVRQVLFLLLCLYPLFIFTQINFDDYFYDKTLRIDYVHTGNHDTDFYSIDCLKEEPYWGGSKKNLIDTFEYGMFKFEVYDERTNKLIYSRGYCTLFAEWQTTNEAKQTYKSFSETIVMPYPKNNVIVVFYTRKKGIFIKKFEYKVNIKSYFISKERKLQYPVADIYVSGSPDKKVDIVFLPEGYTKAELQKFREDCEMFVNYLFKTSPFKENKNKFNIRAVMAPSEESGADIPADGIWKKTILNTSYYTFDSERYLMTEDNKTVRDLAANVPYDQIYIIANTEKYGGGAIFNHYALCINKSPLADYIFIHEFGHSFAGLGDEYYDSPTSYNNFYPLDVEPWEPNLTTNVNFEKKWKILIDKSTPIPTPNHPYFRNKIGMFEGGGYVTKGVYRPAYDCIMKSYEEKNFCRVCSIAIEKMIKFYSE